MIAYTMVFAGLIAIGQSTIGIDISQSCNEFTCLRNDKGVDFTITRAWRSYGAFDSVCVCVHIAAWRMRHVVVTGVDRQSEQRQSGGHSV